MEERGGGRKIVLQIADQTYKNMERLSSSLYVGTQLSHSVHRRVNAQTLFEGDGKYNWSGEKIRSQTGIIEKGYRWHQALTGSNNDILEGDITKRYRKF